MQKQILKLFVTMKKTTKRANEETRISNFNEMQEQFNTFMTYRITE